MTPFAASVALFRDDYVLLIQRAREPSQGKWTLPGGRLEPGETARMAAAREVQEETGFAAETLHAVCQLGVGPGGTAVLEVFVSREFSGMPAFSDEVADHRWVRLADLRGLATTEGLAEVLHAAAAVLAAS